MRSRVGRFLGLLAVLLGSSGTVSAASFDDITAKGEMLVAVYRDFPPFSEKKENGELSGIDIDLAKAIGARMKLNIQFMELTAGESVDDDLRNGVWKGHYLDKRVADLMMHIPVDRVFALRNPNAVIFAPYYRERIAMARNPERVSATDTMDIFAEEKVGVETATLADVVLTAADGGRLVANVIHFPSLAKASAALQAGQVAAVAGCETEIAASLGPQQSRFPLAPVAIPGLSKAGWELGLAVKDSNRQLGHAVEDALDALRLDGTIATIFRSHGIPYTPPEIDNL